MCFLSLIWKIKISHALSEFSKKENMFGVPFEWCKMGAFDQGSESKRQHIGIFPALELRYSKERVRGCFLNQHWCWCLLIELNIICHLDTFKNLFANFLKSPFCHDSKIKLCANIPRYCKEGFLMPNQTLPIQTTLLECLSSKGYSLWQTSAQTARGRTLLSLP